MADAIDDDGEATGRHHSAEAGTVFRRGGISYLHLPAVDPRRSGAFYAAVFGWTLHGDPDHPSFEDGTGHVIGAFVTDRAPSAHSGVLPYVYVDSIDETLGLAATEGGVVERAPYAEGDLWVATMRDPAGNVVGIWQRGPRSA